MVMKNDEFDKLFKYMEKRFDALEKKIDNCADKDSLNALYNSVDHMSKDYRNLVDEHYADIHAHRRFADALEEYDKRLIKLEKLRKIAA